MTNSLRCGKFLLSLERPLVMGIVNLTPDSFSGDGLADNPLGALEHARHQIASGADIIDLGAESSRLGAHPITSDEELRRLLPVLEGLADCPVPISVDTCKPDVMCAALECGASMINDINALQAPGALEAVASSDCAVCLMHMRGDPRATQHAPGCDDVVTDVREFLEKRLAVVKAAGIARDRLTLDPGFGFAFGKTQEDNLELLARLSETACDGLPLLVGLSRKSMLGALTGHPVGKRLAASVAAALIAVERGARIVRVHDVSETCDALRVWQAISEQTGLHKM